MFKRRPSTVLPDDHQPELVPPRVFPQASPCASPAATQLISHHMFGKPTALAWHLHVKAARAWENLGGQDLVGWVFTECGIEFWAQFQNGPMGCTQLLIVPA